MKKPVMPVPTLLVKPTYSNLISINALVCGIEIVSSCAFTYIPPLLLRSGFSETLMTITLGVAPFIDLITVPLLADWSDSCTSSFGRRRPFMLMLCSLLFISLTVIPYSSYISKAFMGTGNGHFNMMILAVGVILLDYSHQALYNPCESLVSDFMTTADEGIRTLAFTIYSACLSLGCIVGYLIVFIDWTSLIPMANLNQTQISFSVASLLLLMSLLLTLSNREQPYSEIRHKSDEMDKLNRHGINDMELKKPIEISLGTNKLYESDFFKAEHVYFDRSGRHNCLKSTLRKLHFKTLTANFRSLKKMICGCASQILYIPYKMLALPFGSYKRIKESALVVRRLFIMELFGWTAVLCHNFFFTDFVAQYIYQGNPNAAGNTTEAILYDQGVRMGSWGLFLQSFLACVYAFFIQEMLVSILGPRKVFLGGLLVLTISLIITPLSPSVQYLNAITALSGIGCAALTTTPNMLLTFYYQNKKIYMQDLFSDSESADSASRGLGSQVSVLDMAYYLSQILISIYVGPVVDLAGSALPYMLIPAVASALALFCGTKIVFFESQLHYIRV